jgi:hypothetical protein
MLLGLLAWSCGWIEEVREVTVGELLGSFGMKTIPKEAFVLTPRALICS